MNNLNKFVVICNLITARFLPLTFLLLFLTALTLVNGPLLLSETKSDPTKAQFRKEFRKIRRHRCNLVLLSVLLCISDMSNLIKVVKKLPSVFQSAYQPYRGS